jgi:putative SOS response-associated peptidase YedK
VTTADDIVFTLILNWVDECEPICPPAILRKEEHEAWLTGSVDEARAALKQYDPGLMVAYEVSTRVNTPKNDDSALVEPVTRAAAETE